MLRSIFLRCAEWVKDIALAVQTLGAPKGQLIPIRIAVYAKHQGPQIRR